MNLVIPFNRQYFEKVYSKDDKYLEKLEKEVIPNLVQRLAMSSAVKSINIYSDIDFQHLAFFSSKIHYIKNLNGDLDDFFELFKAYSRETNTYSGLLVIYNPLYPFIAVKKIEQAYELIKKNKYNSAVGTIKMFRKDVLSYLTSNDLLDDGILSIVKLEDILKKNTRWVEPCLALELSALELISLRSINDLPVYNLVLNSGYKI